MTQYIAHRNEATGAIQTVREHCENTADLCRAYAVEELKDFMYVMGLLHDIGKYQPSFVRRISGENIRVEHSTCGARAAKDLYKMSPMALMMEYCIAGHHSGIPDGGTFCDDESMSTLAGRMKRDCEDYSEYKRELTIPNIDESEWIRLFLEDCNGDASVAVDKFAFLTRYAFSCLVDADSIDTERFCSDFVSRKLNADFEKCLRLVSDQLNSFICTTDLQRARRRLQEQAFMNAEKPAQVYLLNMPTGSGKTLASVKIALEHAVQKKKRRIIYIIPYNSIIEQTAQVFENLFQDEIEILRHQSVYSYEDDSNVSEDYREAAKSAVENWDAPFIVTTAVQFFESVYSNKRGKLRKLHNLSDSILVFDEAHLMPQDYLQPCLQAVAYIVKYLHSEAVFLTATMPDYRQLIHKYAVENIEVAELIQDASSFPLFQNCRYRYLKGISESSLLRKSSEYPSSLIIVNRRKEARELYRSCAGKKYHLSTYMTTFDRKRVLNEIKEELELLDRDYPNGLNVPEERRITIISTSLIEAGVDIDVFTVFRERAGLDSILQAGGRCNREGKRIQAEVFVFDLENQDVIEDVKSNLTKGLMGKYEDISALPCVDEYYSRLFFMEEDSIKKNSMHQLTTKIKSIPFRKYAERFSMIESRTVSIVVPQDEQCQKLVNQMRFSQTGDARRMQNYTCTVYLWELNELITQHVVDDYGTGIYCLINQDYYQSDIGITFEGKDYFI